MKSLSCLGLLGALVATNAQFISVPLSKQALDSESLTKRAFSNGSLQLTAQQNAYTANISIGTPAQNVQLILDTGSPLTWINAKNVSTFTPGTTPTAAQTAQGSAICASQSCFSASGSSTLKVPANSTVFLIEYVDGTESVGRTVDDVVSFQGLVDDTFEFGLVEYSYSPGGSSSAIGGILGLSPPNAVADFSSLSAALKATSATTSFTPQTILQQLQNAGAIQSTAFSLYLSEDSDGELTIGGVDSGRYTGPLTVLPIATVTGADAAAGQSYYVTLEYVGYGGSSGNAITVEQPVVLDSGTTSTYIPAQAAESLVRALNGVFIPYSSGTGLVAIPCSTTTTIDFYFANEGFIQVPTSAILDSELTPSQAARLGITTSSTLCVLSLFGTTDSDAYLLGDSFLRSAYVVYDLAAQSIAIAQAAYDQPSNITAIGTGAYGIPNGVYNSTSSGYSNVAVVPTVTRTLSLGTVVPRTTSAVGAGITGAAATTTAASSTTKTSSSDRLVAMNGSLYIVLTALAFTIAGSFAI